MSNPKLGACSPGLTTPRCAIEATLLVKTTDEHVAMSSETSPVMRTILFIPDFLAMSPATAARPSWGVTLRSLVNTCRLSSLVQLRAAHHNFTNDAPYKRMGVPETFIIDQEGIIREIVIGPRDWTRLDSLQVLTKLLNVTPKTAEQPLPATSRGNRG